MSKFKRKHTSFVFVSVLLTAVFCAHAVQTKTTSRLKGVTITSKIHELKSDGRSTEVGMQTTYISASGSWRKVKTTLAGDTEQVLVADTSRGGVFSVDSSKDEGTKLANFTPKRTPFFDEDGYRKHPQFVREEIVLGFEGFVLQVETPEGGIDSELTFIPEFDTLPVKEVSYLNDGSKRITEPITIKVGEPADYHFKLPSSTKIKEALLNP